MADPKPTDPEADLETDAEEKARRAALREDEPAAQAGRMQREQQERDEDNASDA